jgi:lysophospholipase
MDNPYQLTLETEVDALHQQALPDFWREQAVEGSFTAADGVIIHYAALRQAKVDRAIVIVNGRVESYLKYQELAWDLWRQGYSLYLIDHRGQGLSERLLVNTDKGYVGEFDDYVRDLKQFHDQIIAPDQPTKLFLLAHSMGGAIAAHYMARWPTEITAAVLSSPMMGINLDRLPTWLVRGVAVSIDTVGRWWGEPPYAPGQGDYQPRGFDNNGLTHSASRYALFRQQYEQVPQLKLGGVTAHWLREAIMASQRAIEQAGPIRTPLLVLQASEDEVVDNAAQAAFCVNAPCYGGQPLRIEGAWHELFIEADAQRLPALNATLAFFAQH